MLVASSAVIIITRASLTEEDTEKYVYIQYIATYIYNSNYYEEIKKIVKFKKGIAILKSS